MAGKANIVIDAGTDWTTTINVLDDADELFNFTGYTAISQMRKHSSSLNYVTLNVALHPGEIVLSANASITLNVMPGRYLYDVLITKNGLATRIIEGIATVTPEITKV